MGVVDTLKHSSVSQQCKDIQQQKFLNYGITYLVNGSDMNVKFVDVLKYLGTQIYLESLSNLPNSYMQVQHQLYIARARVKIELLSKWSGRPLY